MRRLREFDSITAFFGDREIDELQDAVDARRQDRAVRPGEPPDARSARHETKLDGPGSAPRRMVGV